MRFVDPLRVWFLARTPRERWLILLMLAIALVVLSWLLVARPLVAGLEAARTRHAAAVQRHGAILAQLAQLENAPRVSVEAASAPLALRIADSATRAGVRLGGSEPRGASSVVVSIAAGPPTTALAWLRQLEAQGISVRELTISPAGQGSVTISATLSERTAA
jgi:general secretion pathway protein M